MDRWMDEWMDRWIKKSINQWIIEKKIGSWNSELEFGSRTPVPGYWAGIIDELGTQKSETGAWKSDDLIGLDTFVCYWLVVWTFRNFQNLLDVSVTHPPFPLGTGKWAHVLQYEYTIPLIRSFCGTDDITAKLNILFQNWWDASSYLTSVEIYHITW